MAQADVLTPAGEVRTRQGTFRTLAQSKFITPGAGGSGRAAADEPDGRGDEEQGEREQPAAFDELEWPEPAGRLVVGPLRVAVLGEALPNKSRLAELAGPCPRAEGEGIAAGGG
jgi:hypothetical protein